MPSGTWPSRVKDFKAWQQLIIEQAQTQDRVHHKKSNKGRAKPSRGRRKRFRGKRRQRKEQ